MRAKKADSHRDIVDSLTAYDNMDAGTNSQRAIVSTFIRPSTAQKIADCAQGFALLASSGRDTLRFRGMNFDSNIADLVWVDSPTSDAGGYWQSSIARKRGNQKGRAEKRITIDLSPCCYANTCSCD